VGPCVFRHREHAEKPAKKQAGRVCAPPAQSATSRFTEEEPFFPSKTAVEPRPPKRPAGKCPVESAGAAPFYHWKNFPLRQYRARSKAAVLTTPPAESAPQLPLHPRDIFADIRPPRHWCRSPRENHTAGCFAPVFSPKFCRRMFGPQIFSTNPHRPHSLSEPWLANLPPPFPR